METLFFPPSKKGTHVNLEHPILWGFMSHWFLGCCIPVKICRFDPFRLVIFLETNQVDIRCSRIPMSLRHFSIRQCPGLGTEKG